MLAIIGLGAGLVSALLFAVVATGTVLGFVLSYVAPLPVFIAALGWNHRSGLIAALAGGAVLAVVLNPVAGLAFACGVAVPAWWISYLALLGRPDDEGQMEWYPVGRLLLWIATTAALVTLAGAMAISGSYEGYFTAMRETLALVLRGGSGMPLRLPEGVSPDDLARFLASAVPVVAGASFVPMILANLWLAARVVKASGRLIRPWPFLPSTRLPGMSLGLAVAAAAGSLALPGFPGLLCAAFAGAMAAVFAIGGLAMLHATTFGQPWRPFALGSVYFSLLIVSTLALPVLAIVGAMDSLFDIRRGASAPPDPPAPTL